MNRFKTTTTLQIYSKFFLIMGIFAKLLLPVLMGTVSLHNFRTSAIIIRSQTSQNLSTELIEPNLVKIEASDAKDKFEIDILGPLPKMGKSGIIDPAYRWQSNTIVYEFDPTFSDAYRSIFMKAMNHITGRTCVIFKERMSEVDFLFVTQGIDCISSIGRRGGKQDLNVAPKCADFASFVHLLVHVIGFGHEHNRDDRDEYVTINLTNVDPSNHASFYKLPPAAYSPFSVPYDYGSITHLGPKTQSSNGQDTIIPKQIGAVIGEAKELSPLDIKKINNMYCKGSLGINIRNRYDGTYLDVKGGLSGEGKEVILNKLKSQDGDSQKWTVNWANFVVPSVGSSIANWAQDGGRLKVLDEESGNIRTWGFASGYRNQMWIAEEVPSPATSSSVLKHYHIKNMSSGRCLSAPMMRCMGLNLFEFFVKKFIIHNHCRNGQVKTQVCKPDDRRQLWNIEFL